jgi:DNA ligase-1
MKKTLYKLDNKGKTRIWNIWTEDGMLIQESGILDGKLVQHSKQCKAKNIGKSNETSPEEQALLELESEYKGKLTEGYFETIDEAKSEVVLLPMLAKSYNDEKKKIDWSNCFIQPKLDGMRCLAHIKSNGDVTLISRDGKIITNMEHIMDDLSTIRQDIILDGELYAHGLSFQENMKLIKKYRPGLTEQIKYHVYDIVTNKPFKDRKVRSYIKNLSTCKEVSTYQINNESQLLAYHTINIKDGYEGSIIRHSNDNYKLNGRSSSLLKYKNFEDITLPIIDITPNEVNENHGTPWFEYKGKKFKAGCKLSHYDRELLLLNKTKYIGRMGEIRYFELTDEGIPRFPIFHGFRLDK